MNIVERLNEAKKDEAKNKVLTDGKVKAKVGWEFLEINTPTEKAMFGMEDILNLFVKENGKDTVMSVLEKL